MAGDTPGCMLTCSIHVLHYEIESLGSRYEVMLQDREPSWAGKLFTHFMLFFSKPSALCKQTELSACVSIRVWSKRRSLTWASKVENFPTHTWSGNCLQESLPTSQYIHLPAYWQDSLPSSCKRLTAEPRPFSSLSSGTGTPWTWTSSQSQASIWQYLSLLLLSPGRTDHKNKQIIKLYDKGSVFEKGTCMRLKQWNWELGIYAVIMRSCIIHS